MLSNSNYKVRADPIDWRDRYYNFARVPLREVVDLRPWSSAIEDQQHLGSCTGHAIVGAFELMLKKQNPDSFVDLSRLFVYYNARLIEGVVNNDDGAYVRDAIKAVNQYGVCKEELWPYVLNLYSVTPPAECYEDAKNRVIDRYYKLQNLHDILDALNADHPIVTSIEVYTNFEKLESTSDYVLKLPESTDTLLGAHAITLVGYDQTKRLILARNSFGDNWCMQGYFWISFDYVEKHVMDSWIFDIKVFENL